LMKSDSSLLQFLNDMEAFGLTVVEGAPIAGTEGLRAVTDLCNRVAFPMETNYGTTFTVKSKLNPSNLAYTPARLGLHVDLPFYKDPPGIQLLHCLAQSNNITGGENFFSDGFHAANLLKVANSDAYKMLTTRLVDFYDYELITWLTSTCSADSGLTSDGEYEMICYNNQVRDTYLNMPADQVQLFYDALKAFDTLLHGEQCSVSTKLKEGDIVTFDNRRVLHGRNSYTVHGTAERHLEGAYLRWDEVYSRIRRLEESVRSRQP
uniref:TauD domain-containing protein n=1 Tax=Macrostomum lignano TaxID=282301 RepID=A0A1I8GXY2_9PLAT